jgi:uncharacterized protein (TIRG00374 family)
MMSRRRLLWNALGVALGLGLLVWTFWHVDAHGLADALRGSDPFLVAAVGVLNFVVIALKAWRWQVVIGATQPVPYRLVGLSTLIGFMANNVLPARAGELVRIILLGRRGGVSKTSLLASMGVDKLVEGASLIAVVALLPLLAPTPLWFRSAAWILGGVLGALLALGVLAAGSKEHRWLDRLPLSARARDKVTYTLTRLSAGFAALRSPRHFGGALVIAITTWFVSGVMVWVCLRSLHLELSLVLSFMVLMAINLFVMVPAAPGSVGTFEFAAVQVLGFLGIDKTRALAFGLVYHTVQLIPTILVGLAALPAVGIHWRDLKESEATTEPATIAGAEPLTPPAHS